MYGSNMSNSDRHNNYPLPNILVGGGNGTLKGGQHIELPERTPLANLHLTVLNKAGRRAEELRRQHRRDRGSLSQVCARGNRRSGLGVASALSRRAVLKGALGGLVGLSLAPFAGAAATRSRPGASTEKPATIRLNDKLLRDHRRGRQRASR